MRTYVGTSCTDCGQGPMIGSKSKTKHAPGAIIHGSGGRCTKCYGKWKWRRDHPDAVSYRTRPASVAELQHQHNLRALAGYLAGRRRRGIPPEGKVSYRDPFAA